jgi:hypothetical protein
MTPTWTTFAVAEAVCLLTRSKEVLVLLKRSNQRTATEAKQIRQGLGRDVFGEFLLFVPASAFIVLETVRYMLPTYLTNYPSTPGVLGLLSYGFPLRTLRTLVVRLALRNLAEFRDVLDQGNQTEPSGQSVAPAGGPNA